MLFTGLPREGWRDWHYESVQELADPKKALARWVGEREQTPG